jgi:hypothetical protein
MINDRWWIWLWLPVTFVVEVAAWEIGSRLEISLVDPSWEAFGRLIDVERVAWILGGAAALLFGAFMLLARRHSTAQVSLVQLVGVLALACYWIGASIVASGAAVLVSTLAAWILGRRKTRSRD